MTATERARERETGRERELESGREGEGFGERVGRKRHDKASSGIRGDEFSG